MAILLRKEFERDGIHLELFERRRFISLQNDITRLSMKFQHTIHTAREYIEVPEKKIKGIPSSILAACERQSSSGTYKVPTDLHVMNTILKWIADPQVRKEMYLVGNSCAKENLEILDALRQKRHELAKLLGFESYVDFATCDRMIRTPETILTFLKNLSQKLMYKANQELQLILQAKQKLEGAHETQVYLWDLPYYMGMLKAKHFQIDSRIISSYFPLEHCIEGLHLICEKLFGVQLKQVSMGKYEAWHSDVKKLVVLNHKKEILGHIYFDLYPRSHKYNHAAHFTIRCGKKNGPNKYQTPIVALVCNFTKPAPHTPSLLNHSEVETLFHEFGHAMHSLLSRTEFQHLSGTRAQLDFVETPSHLFEYFTWDYRVVKEFALHHKTKEPIPEEMMINLKKSKHMFAAMDTQTQCLYSLLDLKVFGSQPLECDPPTTTETLKVLQGQHTLIPHTPNTYWHTRFGHLIGYGAGYYSYLYARVFASNIWNACFHEDPLSREAGKKIFQEMLIHGGAKDPQVMLRDLLGEEPSAERYLTELEVLEDEKYT
jgi:intermediate peptidase